MALLSAQSPGISGAAVTYVAAAAGGDSFAAGPTSVAHVKNGGGASITVTINSRVNCNQGFDHDLVVTVPAGGERLIGPFDTRFWNVDNEIPLTYSAVTSVTVAAIKL